MRLLYAVELAIKQRRYTNKSQLLTDAGANKNFFGDISSGKSKTPNRDTVQKISELAGINTSFVYFGHGPALIPAARSDTGLINIMVSEPDPARYGDDKYLDAVRECVLSLRSLLSNDNPVLVNDLELNQQLAVLLGILIKRLQQYGS